MGTAQGRPTTGTTDGGIRALEIRGAFADGFAPHYSSAEAAGADLYAMVPEPLELLPGQRIAIPTGVRLEIPKGYEGQVRPRSGLAFKHGVTVLNAPGTIDSDYRGEVRVTLVNLGDVTYVVQRHDRIAQLVIAPVTRATFVQAVLADSDRGDGGFGSTGR